MSDCEPRWTSYIKTTEACGEVVPGGFATLQPWYFWPDLSHEGPVYEWTLEDPIYQTYGTLTTYFDFYITIDPGHPGVTVELIGVPNMDYFHFEYDFSEVYVAFDMETDPGDMNPTGYVMADFYATIRVTHPELGVQDIPARFVASYGGF